MYSSFNDSNNIVKNNGKSNEQKIAKQIFKQNKCLNEFKKQVKKKKKN